MRQASKCTVSIRHTNTDLHSLSYESIRFEFLEAYVERIDGAYAVQVWNTIHTFTKDFIAAPIVHKYRLLPSLRLVPVLQSMTLQKADKLDLWFLQVSDIACRENHADECS